MAKKCKIWMSVHVLDDDFLYDIEGVNPNTEEYRKIFAQSRFNQIKMIKESLEALLNLHKEIELEGFYISSGATYYVALSLERKFEEYVYELPLIRLRNSPNTCYSRIDINEEYETLKAEAEQYNNSVKAVCIPL